MLLKVRSIDSIQVGGATNTKDAFQSVSILTSLQHLALLTLFQNSPLPNPLPILRSPSHGIFLSLKPPQLSMLSFHQLFFHCLYSQGSFLHSPMFHSLLERAHTVHAFNSYTYVENSQSTDPALISYISDCYIYPLFVIAFSNIFF